MDTNELITEAIKTLSVNKLRTGLASLGIVIGIGSVISLVSLGQASAQSIQNQIQSLGSNLLTVQPAGQNQSGVRGAAGGGTTLTWDDAKAIASSNSINSVKTVSPEYSSRSQISTGKSNTNTQVVGATSTYQAVHNISIASGRYITEQDVNEVKKIAVVGPTVVQNLFGEGTEVIGQTIRINSQSLTIVGVTTSKGGSSFQNQDDMVYVPLSTAQKQLFGANHLSTIAIEAKSAEVMIDAQNEVGYFLLARHRLTDPTKADFSIFNQQDILNTVSQSTNTFTTLLAGVAAISLLVGGIGIMNIMLMTITERTREIGLRKALGAKKHDITRQILIESIVLTFVGGTIGIVLGVVASYLITLFTGSLFIVSGYSIALAFVVSVTIGIIFGWVPAKKAANLQPIEALRYE
jgi:putative ABC transport system permease protein